MKYRKLVAFAILSLVSSVARADTVESANTADDVFEELKFEVDTDADFYTVVQQLRDAIAGLDNLVASLGKSDEKLPEDLDHLFDSVGFDRNALKNVPASDNRFNQRNWEVHNIGVPNWTREIEIRLLQLEIKHYEHLALSIDLPKHIASRLASAKEDLLEMVETEIRVD